MTAWRWPLDRDRLNQTAAFLPMDPEDPSTLPAVSLGGALAFVYVDDTDALVMSLHLDTVDMTAIRPDDDGCLRISVTIEDTTQLHRVAVTEPRPPRRLGHVV